MGRIFLLEILWGCPKPQQNTLLVKERKLWCSKRNNHRTTPHAFLVGGVRLFTRLVSEFCDKACDCCTPLIFIC